ncbi:hypothetical protein ACLIBH_00960 [Virgibacillus sp. W0430]|uniref:hypothetical protein n=1 Tax=Virgibacillus sp. W0430 TaxID=3391580 RepID=UPI003F46331F
MNQYSKTLLRFSALFALLGAFLGSHMAGAGSLQFKTLHAHILVVGWLTLFAWAVFYKIFTPAKTVVATLHVWSAIIGSIGLTVGMWFYYLRPFGMEGALPTVFFIVGGTVLLLSFVFFLLLTFMKTEKDK